MGFLALPKFDPPRPKIWFLLERFPENMYRMGDTVRGTLKVEAAADGPPDGETLDHLRVVFAGCNDVQFRFDNNGTRSRTNYWFRDATPLFEETRDIMLPGSLTLFPGEQYRFPFSFTFPAMTQTDATFKYETPFAKRGGWVGRRHPLPPSYYFEEGVVHTSVLYELRASLDSALRKQPMTLTGPRVTYRPFPLLPNPPEKVDTIRKFELGVSRLDPSQGSLKRAMSNVFVGYGSKVPFTVQLSTPAAVMAGASFPVTALLAFEDPQLQMLTLLDDVTFSLQHIRLTSTAASRAPRDRTDDFWNTGPDEFTRSDLEEVELTKRAEPLKVQRSYDENGAPLGRWTVETLVAVPSLTCPTFQSYSVNLSWTLEATLVVAMGGKTFKVKKIPSESFSVLPPPLPERLSQQTTAPQMYDPTSQLAEVNGDSSAPPLAELNSNRPPAELHGSIPLLMEMDATRPPVEMDRNRAAPPPVELSATNSVIRRKPVSHRVDAPPLPPPPPPKGSG